MHGDTHNPEQTPHLAPALTAVILGAAVLSVFGACARSLEERSIGALAANDAIIAPQGTLYLLKNQGVALQRAAFEAGSLLPLYGSSELNLNMAYNRPYHATELFRGRPTGFAVFPVGKEATTCLIMLQKLAAVGPALRGRKVAVSVSPFWFFQELTAWAGGYAGNFSDLHAGELAFNPRLSLALRQDAARRMLRYPETLADRPLLRFALENLADGSPPALAAYGASLPLGLLHNAILRYQDHWNVVRFLWRHPATRPLAAPPRGGHPPDWPSLHRQAVADYRPHSVTNEFGLDDKRWDHKLRAETLRQRGTMSDAAFLLALRQNQEWVDLDLLLRVLEESGAEPFVLSVPMHGGWYDHAGVSSTARRAYYQKLRETAARRRAPVIDFADHDADRSFCFDYKGHLAPDGWVHYDQALDAFFHGETPAPSDLPAHAPPGRRRTEPTTSAR